MGGGTVDKLKVLTDQEVMEKSAGVVWPGPNMASLGLLAVKSKTTLRILFKFPMESYREQGAQTTNFFFKASVKLPPFYESTVVEEEILSDAQE